MVIKKPATKERKGINPFTKEPTVFKAKPARKVLKARPVKAAKDAVCSPLPREARECGYLKKQSSHTAPLARRRP